MEIIVCDDHPVVRHGLRHLLLQGIKGGRVREAESGQHLLDLVRRVPVDVVLLDLGLGGRSGLDVLRQIKGERPRLPVLILTVHPPEQYALRAFKAGAAGYLTKDMPAEELVKAVRTAASGQRYVTPEVANRLADFCVRPDACARHEVLSDREFEILRLIGSGQSPSQIASELCVSYSTVNTYRTRIRLKLGLTSAAEIMRYALREGLAE
jgi:DNA-binding NarL/FixJ family response regulator